MNTAIARRWRRAARAGFLLLTIAAAPAAQAAGVALPPLPGLPGVGEGVVVHDQAGIALSGFDPVAYFIDGRPRGGLPAHELVHAGAVWRFASRANLEAFRNQPDAFIPVFGGYDAVAVAEGRAAEAGPDHFAIIGGRLYTLRSAASLAALRADPRLLARAEERWPEVERQLAR